MVVSVGVSHRNDSGQQKKQPAQTRCGAGLSKKPAKRFEPLACGLRSPDPHPRPVTPELFSDDIAALVQEIPLEKPISAFGVSSGGQAVLALAKFHPDITRNGVVHKAALQADTPIK